MNIYKAIKDDHKIQRDLIEKIKNTKNKGKKERLEAYNQFKMELKAHEVAEERFFYKPVIKTDKMIEDARHGMAEHHEMDEIMETLEDIKVDTDTWYDKVIELCHKVDHHLKDEEGEFFDHAKKIYSDSDAEKLAKDYQSEMNEYRKEYGS